VLLGRNNPALKKGRGQEAFLGDRFSTSWRKLSPPCTTGLTQLSHAIACPALDQGHWESRAFKLFNQIIGKQSVFKLINSLIGFIASALKPKPLRAWHRLLCFFECEPYGIGSSSMPVNCLSSRWNCSIFQRIAHTCWVSSVEFWVKSLVAIYSVRVGRDFFPGTVSPFCLGEKF
jgi:hypothetical protein